jgi:hypothetical protein
MDKKSISMVSGAALLALTGTAWAGPMSVASEKVITPPMQTEQAAYICRHVYRHHVWYRHRYHHRYVWRKGWHYGWYRARAHRYAWWRYRHYGYAYSPWYGYYNPAYGAANVAGAAVGTALGFAAAPFEAATGTWPYYYGYPGYAYSGWPY